MKIAVVVLLILCNILAIKRDAAIHLYTHEWCLTCKRAKAIFNKISTSFPQLQFIVHEHTGKTILFSNSSSNTSSSLPFPTIIFQCSDNKFSYQNDLTIGELSYWVNVSCMRRIPLCTMKINEELYHVAIRQPQQKDISGLIQTMERHPHIKLCLSANSNRSSAEGKALLELSDSKTLYFDYFSHSLRNYLIASKKLAIALFTSNKNTSKVQSFFSTFVSLGNYMGQIPANKTNNIYRFQLQQSQKEQLMFLELCLNKNSSKCVLDPNRKQQISSAQKVAKKLIKFLDIPYDEGTDMEYIVAFRFNHPSFQVYTYQYSFGQLDEKFIFWINQLLSSDETVAGERHRCHGNIVIHRVSEDSLQDVQTHLYLADRLKSINEELQRPYSLQKIVNTYHSQAKLTLCKVQQMPVNYSYNRQVRAVLESILQSSSAIMNDL